MPNQKPTSQKHESMVEPHFYRSKQAIEQEWKDILHNASLNLLSALIRHFTSIIEQESTNMRDLEKRYTS